MSAKGKRMLDSLELPVAPAAAAAGQKLVTIDAAVNAVSRTINWTGAAGVGDIGKSAFLQELRRELEWI